MGDKNPATCIVVDASGSYIGMAARLLPIVAEALNQDFVYVYFTDHRGVEKKTLLADDLKTAKIVDEDGRFTDFPPQVTGGGSGIQAGIDKAHEDGYMSMIILTDGYFMAGS